MKILIPRRLNVRSMFSFLENIINAEREPLHDEIILDFSGVMFMEPVGIAILSNTIEFLKKNEIKVSFVGHTAFTDVNKYMDDSLFFQEYLNKKMFSESEVRSTTLPLQLLRHKDTYSWIVNKMIPWLEGRLSMSKYSFTSIQVCLQELFNNIDDHAQEEIGSIFVQHYPNKNEINIALSDFGVGIPQNVRKNADPAHDGAAILIATAEGFTTKSTIRNAGAGLDIFLRTIAKNKGHALIYSGKGRLLCDKNTRRPERIDGIYPGTLFNICFRTDTIERAEDIKDEVFQW